MSFEFPPIRRERTPEPPESSGDEVKPTPKTEKKSATDGKGGQENNQKRKKTKKDNTSKKNTSNDPDRGNNIDVTA